MCSQMSCSELSQVYRSHLANSLSFFPFQSSLFTSKMFFSCNHNVSRKLRSVYQNALLLQQLLARFCCYVCVFHCQAHGMLSCIPVCFVLNNICVRHCIFIIQICICNVVRVSFLSIQVFGPLFQLNCK